MKRLLLITIALLCLIAPASAFEVVQEAKVTPNNNLIVGEDVTITCKIFIHPASVVSDSSLTFKTDLMSPQWDFKLYRGGNPVSATNGNKPTIKLTSWWFKYEENVEILVTLNGTVPQKIDDFYGLKIEQDRLILIGSKEVTTYEMIKREVSTTQEYNQYVTKLKDDVGKLLSEIQVASNHNFNFNAMQANLLNYQSEIIGMDHTDIKKMSENKDRLDEIYTDVGKMKKEFDDTLMKQIDSNLAYVDKYLNQLVANGNVERAQNIAPLYYNVADMKQEDKIIDMLLASEDLMLYVNTTEPVDYNMIATVAVAFVIIGGIVFFLIRRSKNTSYEELG